MYIILDRDRYPASSTYDSWNCEGGKPPVFVGLSKFKIIVLFLGWAVRLVGWELGW